MKQGSGNKTSAPKSGSRTSHINIEAVSEMGAHEARLKKEPSLVQRTTVQAPKGTTTQHRTGSQGKHK